MNLDEYEHDEFTAIRRVRIRLGNEENNRYLSGKWYAYGIWKIQERHGRARQGETYVELLSTLAYVCVV